MGGSRSSSPDQSAGANRLMGSSPGAVSTEFEADNPQQMPVYNSPAQVEAAKKKRQEVLARSGRGSTNLVGNPGTASYANSFLGSVT